MSHVVLLLVFMWHSHIPKLVIAFPSEGLVSSDYRPYRTLVFYNVLAWQGSLFCKKGTLEFPSVCIAWLKWLPEKAVMRVKKWVIALVLGNWTIFAPEEIVISTCRSSRVGFNSKTQQQMFLLLYSSHVCAPPRGTNMASPYKAL